MWKRVIAVCKRWVSPGSLRSQLLWRSLLLLAVILLLLGVVQYLVTKDFLYRNNADAMMTQMRSLPRSVYMDNERSERSDRVASSTTNNSDDIGNASDNMETTPLTSIHGFLEVLLRGAAAKPEQLEVGACG